MTDDSDRPGRDYDASRLARFEDGPADDVAADLAKLMGRKPGAATDAGVTAAGASTAANPVGESTTTDPSATPDPPSRRPSRLPSARHSSPPGVVLVARPVTPPLSNALAGTLVFALASRPLLSLALRLAA